MSVKALRVQEAWGMDEKALSASSTAPHLRVRIAAKDHSPAEPFTREAGASGPTIAASRGTAWAQRLRRALREQRFVLHYQPIACVRTGRVSHYEALVRLADGADGELVAPNLFLPAAERHGLIGELDRLVIRQVATRLGERVADAGESTAAWGDGELRVAVNLSAQSACDPGMLEFVERELATHGVEPARMVFEITETAAIADIEQAKALCMGLQALGCAVALDDFGAGFGSFYYAKHLPFRYLKIDGEFIRELRTSARDQLIVRALVKVARGMNMQTIAEFVTDAATLEVLRRLGVDYAQGFEIGRPAPLTAATATASA